MEGVTDIKSRVSEAARQVPGFRAVFLFGSQVTGRTWAESDLDIAVRFEHDLCDEAKVDRRLRLIAALTDLLGKLGERADIVDLDRAPSALAFRAVRDGVCVFSLSEAERIRAVVDVARRYDDEAPYRALWQRAARRAVRKWAGARMVDHDIVSQRLLTLAENLRELGRTRPAP